MSWVLQPNTEETTFNRSNYAFFGEGEVDTRGSTASASWATTLAVTLPVATTSIADFGSKAYAPSIGAEWADRLIRCFIAVQTERHSRRRVLVIS